ncbi:MAG: GH3 auxin-responsive promoter family protein [Flavobacteriales bacterium]|nr:GH3 auxin-responsive promoter family protein [Flavobacteriales bacterium]
MGIKASLSKPYARLIKKKINRLSKCAVQSQKEQFLYLIERAKTTKFGKDHGFSEIKTYDDFKARVPVRDYEGLKSYIDEMVSGKPDVLWPGKPLYLCKTSGTTSGTKYIPLTKESMPNHINSAKYALLSYIAETGNASFVDGKMIFLQGSPELSDKNGIPLGRLSGIVAHHVPQYLQRNRMPSYATNCIEDWETKVRAIADETIPVDMRLISGIPSWVQMYFELLLEKTGKKSVSEVFPEFSLFVYGGVNFEPYRARFRKLIGKDIDSVELYPASEGFLAFQDSQQAPGLLLTTWMGIFYEFIPADEFFSENPRRLSLEEVELNVNYVIILNTNAGMWAYNIGDTVKFVSLDPYRIIVSGRIKHYTSAFGEHVIGEEVEFAIHRAIQKHGGQAVEFHLAPQVNPAEGLPYHEWFIEFAEEPVQLEDFTLELERAMMEKNIYYNDLIKGNVLQPLKLRRVEKNGFNAYMKSQGKLGGQNKVPKLSNDRKVADGLYPFVKK